MSQLHKWRQEYRQLRKQVVATWDRIDAGTADAICKDLAQRAAGREMVSRDPTWRGIIHKPRPELWVAAMRELLKKGLDVYPY